MAFCTQCGHKNLEGSRFCESCGRPMRGAAAAAQPHESTSVSASMHMPSRRLLWGIGGMLVVLLAAGAMYLWLAPEAPSKAVFARAVQAWITERSDEYRHHYCLRNYDYAADQVTLGQFERGGRQWFDMLVQAGLYSGPKIDSSPGLFVPITFFRYTKTELGRRATRTGELCVADGIEVDEVVEFAPPRRLGGVWVSRADVRIVYRNPAPWAVNEENVQISPVIREGVRKKFFLARKEGRWRVVTEREVQALSVLEKATGSIENDGELASFVSEFAAWLERLFAESSPVGRP